MVKREVQSENQDAKVKVGIGFHRDTKQTVTDFIVVDRKNKEHIHTGINEFGKVLFEKKTSDKNK